MPRARGPNKKPVTVAPGRHPLITELFHLIQSQGYTMSFIARRAGINHVTLHKWAGAHYNPSLVNVEAAYGALGFALTPVPLGKKSNPEPACISDYYLVEF